MITAAMVKDLREKTGAGMMDCKKALQATEGDLEKAIDWLREKGIAKAAKKAGRIAAEGLTKVVVKGNKAAMVEVNSETDFVAKNDLFLATLDAIANAVVDNCPATLEEANTIVYEGKTVDQWIVDATATIGEKISFRRFAVVEKTDAQGFGVYSHMGGKISVVLVTEPANEEVSKMMAMQVCSMNPTYVCEADMPAEVVEHEKSIQREIIKNTPADAAKPEAVQEKMLVGRVAKALADRVLLMQEFAFDSSMKVSAYLKSNNATVKSFVRFAVGEGIEKRQENFADEVANAFK